MTDKDALRKAYLEGYSEGKNVEELSDIAIKTAKQRFNRWYDLNSSGGDE